MIEKHDVDLFVRICREKEKLFYLDNDIIIKISENKSDMSINRKEIANGGKGFFRF